MAGFQFAIGHDYKTFRPHRSFCRTRNETRGNYASFDFYLKKNVRYLNKRYEMKVLFVALIKEATKCIENHEAVFHFWLLLKKIKIGTG